jgi:threonine synthase
MEICCDSCGNLYPAGGLPYLCPKCGGIYEISSGLTYHPDAIDAGQPGLWKFWSSFGLQTCPQNVYLGEGNTPLVWDKDDRMQIGYKLENLNPTGSYKDRGTAVLAAHLLERGINRVVEDSSGNAGASLAGYAARVGIKARIFVPESASGPKREQIVQYGAELVPVPGERKEATRRVREEADRGTPYASHAYIPFGLAGIATIAYELLEQIKNEIGTVIAPVGHGGLLLGIMMGFEALLQAGAISSMPMFIGVQAEHCSPVYREFIGMDGQDTPIFADTVAEGVRVTRPVRGAAVVRMLRRYNGRMIAIGEETILESRNELAHCGIFVEPTSAIVWSGLKLIQNEIKEPAILVMTGSGLKSFPE